MSKNVLVIDGHPDPGPAFCHAAVEAYLDGARQVGAATRMIRLADIDIAPLRSAEEFATPPSAAAILKARDDIIWAEHLVFVFPLWLGSAPAYVRAFFEQISRDNFVAAIDGKGVSRRLRGKSARLIVTMGMPSLVYRFVFGAHGVRSIEASILGFAGVAPTRSTLIGMIEGDAARQQSRLARLRGLGLRLA